MCEGQTYEKALELLKEMRQKGIELDMITYGATISACQTAKQLDKASELLAEMWQKGLERDVLTYSAAISACEKGQADRKGTGAPSWPGADIITSIAVISARGKAEHPGMAWSQM